MNLVASNYARPVSPTTLAHDGGRSSLAPLRATSATNSDTRLVPREEIDGGVDGHTFYNTLVRSRHRRIGCAYRNSLKALSEHLRGTGEGSRCNLAASSRYITARPVDTNDRAVRFTAAFTQRQYLVGSPTYQTRNRRYVRGFSHCRRDVAPVFFSFTVRVRQHSKRQITDKQHFQITSTPGRFFKPRSLSVCANNLSGLDERHST